MKKLSAYFFLLILFSFSLHQALLFSIFVLNQDAIAAEFCVNKDKPELQCNGKCHLKDLLAESEEEGYGFHFNFQEQVVLPVFYSDLSVILPCPVFIETWASQNQILLNSILIEDYFHPPQELDFIS